MLTAFGGRNPYIGALDIKNQELPMQGMDRTRIIFIAIVGLAIVAICGVVAVGAVRNLLQQSEATPVFEGTVEPLTTSAPAQIAVVDSPEPIWGPDYDSADGRPSYICGADTFGSYFTLQQMQMSGKDIEHGFHLGIVPFFLDDDPAYDVSEEQRTALLNSGVWNCLLTTLDSVALSSPGIITAIVDESAGADQLWARDISTINDVEKRRRILRLLYVVYCPTQSALRRDPGAPG
jgi:hypothetical protein